MYKDYREPEEEIKVYIEIDVDVGSVRNTCYGYPTTYDFKDKEGTNYFFRLRHGVARIECEDTEETLLTEEMEGFDGVCGFDDVIAWALKYGIKIKY